MKLFNNQVGEEINLKRVEEYRRKRQQKRKCFYAVVSFIVLFIIGIISVDYSINKLMYGKDSCSIVYAKRTGINSYEIYILNKPIKFDTSYIKRDIAKIRKAFSGN